MAYPRTMKWIAVCAVNACCTHFAAAEILTPPVYELKNRHQVDLSAGQVAIAQTDIKIGGNLGLSHTLSTFTSNFVNIDDEPGRGMLNSHGFYDSTSTFGIVWVDNNDTKIGQQQIVPYVKIIADGKTAAFYYNDTKTEFRPKSDSRYTLQLVTINGQTDNSRYSQDIIDFALSIGGFTGFLMTEPDGSVVYIPYGAQAQSSSSSSSSSAPSSPQTYTTFESGNTDLKVTYPAPYSLTNSFKISWSTSAHHVYVEHTDWNSSTYTSKVNSFGTGYNEINEQNVPNGVSTYLIHVCTSDTQTDCPATPISVAIGEQKDRAYMPSSETNYIQRPNGLIMRYKGGAIPSSITTNTGFQLKYLYQKNTHEIPFPANDTLYPKSGATGWSGQNPKYIVGINNAVDACSDQSLGSTNNEGQSFSTILSDSCGNASIGTYWPKTTYTWPDGMPRIMFLPFNSDNSAPTPSQLKDKTFTVTDPAGIQTEYIHAPIDTKGYPGYYATAVRLLQIKRAGKQVANYVFDTSWGDAQGWKESCWQGFCVLPNKYLAANLRHSSIGADKIGYSVGHGGNPNQGTSGNTSYGEDGTINANQQTLSGRNGLIHADLWDKTVMLEDHPSNRLTDVLNNMGKSIKIGYSDLNGPEPYYSGITEDWPQSHNVTSITEYSGDSSLGATKTADGFTRCTLKNYKVCNQATMIKDARDNITSYEYDPASGLPKRVTLPAVPVLDDKGVIVDSRSAQTYTVYDKYYAVYKKNGSSVATKETLPVYLPSKEFKCLASNLTASDSSQSCSDGTPPITTSYYYGPQDGSTPNNLLLKGVAVTAQVTNSKGSPIETHLTCYEYDAVGNRIGETKPNAYPNATPSSLASSCQ